MVGVRVLNIQNRRFGQATLRIEERKGLARANLLLMNLLRKNGFTRVTKGTTGPQRTVQMHIIVHVRNKPIAVSVGEPGLQPVRWLANVGTARYDAAQGRCLGFPVGVRLEDGSLLGLNQSLAEAGLRDMQHVWVVYKGGGSGE
jgi:hypothetical protein